MLDFFLRLFSSQDFMPRRACGEWTENLILLHTVSDGLIWLSYTLIPFTMLWAYRLWRRGRLELQPIADAMPRLIWLYVLFIFLCGTTHFDNILVFWIPSYRVFGLVTFVTGIVSVLTVLSLGYVVRLAARPLPLLAGLRKTQE